MTSKVFTLHWLVAVCRLSMQEKGKKRAKCGKCLVPVHSSVQPSGISLRSHKLSLRVCFDKLKSGLPF
jgi:hypothetical protein